MENYEYNPAENPAPEQEAPVKKASPFADSPYEFQMPAYDAPKKVKKPKTGRGKTFLCAFAVLALVAGSCLSTAAVLNAR